VEIVLLSTEGTTLNVRIADKADYWITLIRHFTIAIDALLYMPLMEEFKYSDITRKIIGCAMNVHKYLGNGFQEVIYQIALAYEIELVQLNFVRELENGHFL
jgi:hypothetical protein